MKIKNIRFKSIAVIFLAFLVLFLVGCNREEEQEPVYSVELNSSEETLEVGEEFTLISSVFADGEKIEAEVTWTSSVPGIVSLEAGVVTALSAGETVITASYKGASDSCTIYVTEIEEVFLLLSRSEAVINVNDVLTLTAELTDGTTPEIAWASDNEAVATVQDGVVTALSSGTAKITASVGELVAECIITVNDVLELIFPEMEEEYFLGDEVDLEIIIKENGTVISDTVTVTGTGFTYENGKITVTSMGAIEVTASYENLAPIKRTFISYKRVSSVADLQSIADDLSGYYKLTNDIEVNGTILTIAHYNDGYNKDNGFSGVLDGNGFSIKNFTAVYSNPSIVANCSLFGVIATNGIVRNLNVVNLTIDKRISGGIATISYGRIENCFIDAYVTYNSSGEHNNPIGGITSKNYGTIENSIVVMKLKEGIADINIGAITGRDYASSVIKNSYAIAPVGVYESASPNHDGTSPNLGTAINSESYPSIEEFYLGANLTTFKSEWNFEEGYYPTFGNFETSVAILNTETNIYSGTSLQIECSGELEYKFRIKEEIAGVTISNTGLLTVDLDVPVDTVITVVLQSLYSKDAFAEYQLTVLENDLAAHADKTEYSFTIIHETSTEEDLKVAHNILVTKNGEEYLGDITFRSSDENVAVIQGEYLYAIGEGTARIDVIVDEIVLLSINVTNVLYFPIFTNQDFLAIGTNLETLSKKYILMNDLDFNNAKINAFSSYKTFNSSGLAFSGVFDGNNHSLMNFEPSYNTADPSDRDISLFGYLTSTAVVRNVNFIGVIGKDRVSVVSNWNEGLIENVYVEMNYVFTAASGNKNNNNPGGVIVAKNRSTGTVSNSVVVFDCVEGANLQYLGGVVGNNAGAISNVQLITAKDVPVTYSGTGSVANSSKYQDLTDFYENADLEAYGSDWTFTEGLLPHLGEFVEEFVLNNENLDLYAGTSLTLNVSSNYSYRLSLKESVEGVTLNGNVLSASSEVPVGTKITVLVASSYTAAVLEVDVFLLENSYEAIDYQDVYDFEFVKGVSEESLYTATPEITVLYNGNPWTGVLTAQSENEAIAVYEDGLIVALGDGSTTITFFADGVMVATVTVNSVMYHPIRTVAELEAIGTDINTLSQKYKLMNDINVNGTLKTIAHYNDGYQSSANGFKGIFDGNGYSIKNFSAVYKTPSVVANCSLFGTVAATGVIRNLNIVNVTIDKRISGGIATINYGTIENCFVDVLFTYSTASDHNNPMGGIVSKNYGVILNVIAAVRIKEGIQTANIGSIAGRAYPGSSISNSYAISPLGLFESATPANGGIDDGETTGSEAYPDLEEFYLHAELESFDQDWTFTEGKLPYFGIFDEDIVILNENFNLYTGIPYSLDVQYNYRITISLKESIAGVTLEGNVLTVESTVAVGTKVVVVVKSIYTTDVIEIELTVSDNPFEVADYQETYEFSFIKDVSDESQYSKDLTITILFEGEPWSGELNWQSANDGIAILENNKVVALGDGTTTIDLYADSIYLVTITVESAMYNPVYTNEDFLVIGTNLETLSKKYILMNDLDFNNAKINAFSSYKTFNSSGLAFSGVFDGNNYSLMNFEPSYNTADPSDRDISLFGFLRPTAVVRNVNFIGVIGKDRVSVVSNWNEGLIENVYVEMNYVFTAASGNKNNNNPGGVIVAKNRSTGTVSNSVVVFDCVEGANLQYLGGVVGNNAGAISNVQLITAKDVPVTYSGTGSVANSSKYQDLTDFYENADLEAYGSDWTFTEGLLPHLGEFVEEFVVHNEALEIAQSSTVTLSVSSKYGHYLELKNGQAGVSLNGNDLSVEDVEIGTEIVIQIKSNYVSDVQEFTFIVVG